VNVCGALVATILMRYPLEVVLSQSHRIIKLVRYMFE